MTKQSNQNQKSSSTIDLMESYPCQLRHLNLSCYGCCGVKFSNQEDVESDIASFTLLKELKGSTFKSFYDLNVEK